MNESLAKLQRISEPRRFVKDEYICFEGKPGEEMYVILYGEVGVFITSPIGTLTEVARLKPGSFFGEMAIFDNQPRSASCIALEESICVAVDKNNIKKFFEFCPDMAKAIMKGMSSRIRNLNIELYKRSRSSKKHRIPRFFIPTTYSFGHLVDKPFQDPEHLEEFVQFCPVCGGQIKSTRVLYNTLEVAEERTDGRTIYRRCDPLWLNITTCPHCHYSNHYLNFFKINEIDLELVKNVLSQQTATISSYKNISSEFDRLVLSYLQAININEALYDSDNVLIGSMYMNLYWLCDGEMDKRFVNYCAKNAVKKFRVAIDDEQISDNEVKGRVAFYLSSLLVHLDMYRDALEYLNLAILCPDQNVRKFAQALKKSIDKT